MWGSWVLHESLAFQQSGTSHHQGRIDFPGLEIGRQAVGNLRPGALSLRRLSFSKCMENSFRVTPRSSLSRRPQVTLSLGQVGQSVMSEGCGCCLMCHKGPWDRVTELAAAAAVTIVVLRGPDLIWGLCHYAADSSLIPQLSQVSGPRSESTKPGIFPSVFIFMAAIKLYCWVNCWTSSKSVLFPFKVASSELHSRCVTVCCSNHVRMTFSSYLDCLTRFNKTIDLIWSFPVCLSPVCLSVPDWPAVYDQ